MSEHYPSYTISLTSDGDAAISAWMQPSILLRVDAFKQSNQSYVGVIDNITFAYDNRANSEPANVAVKIIPAGTSYPIWAAMATIPAYEQSTIDKQFVHGLPLWTGVSSVVAPGADDHLTEFGPTGGSAFTGSNTTMSIGSVTLSVEDTIWNNAMGHGGGCFSITYHLEPSSNRRY